MDEVKEAFEWADGFEPNDENISQVDVEHAYVLAKALRECRKKLKFSDTAWAADVLTAKSRELILHVRAEKAESELKEYKELRKSTPSRAERHFEKIRGERDEWERLWKKASLSVIDLQAALSEKGRRVERRVWEEAARLMTFNKYRWSPAHMAVDFRDKAAALKGSVSLDDYDKTRKGEGEGR